MISDCQHCLDLLDDYRRGQLGSSEKATLETHLQQCAECSAELDFRNRLALGLRDSLPATQLNNALSPAVLSAISSAAQTLPQRQKNKLLPWMLSAAAVLIVLIAALQQRTPEITGEHKIVTLYSESDLAPAGSMKKESIGSMEDSQEAEPGESASQKLLFDAEPPAQESDLGLMGQMKPEQEIAQDSNKEYGYAAVPTMSRAAQIPPATVSAPAVARREIAPAKASSFDAKRRSDTRNLEYVGSAGVAAEANAGALAQPTRDRYFMESTTSSADVRTSVAVTSGTLSTTNTLTTGSR